MRGVILAGGTGSRLGALTKTINKHLLPVGDVPMVYHPLRVLRDNDIEDITIVSSPSGVGQLAALLGSGHDHGCRFAYRVQDQPGGIAAALACADDGTDEPVTVILGDNVFLPSPMLHDATENNLAFTVLYRALPSVLHQFGVPIIERGMITEIVEKPAVPPSAYAVTGMYIFGSGDYLRENLQSTPVGVRGELEIADLLNTYARGGTLLYGVVGGFWGDAGTHDGLAECAAAVRAWEGRK